MGLSSNREHIISVYVIFAFLSSALMGILLFQDESSNYFVSGTTIIVDYKGDGNFTSIQSAIDSASPGDTIYVWAGTYYENITIDKKVKLIGNCSEETIIDGKGALNVVNITSDYVEFLNFTVRNSSSNTYINSGLLNIDHADYVKVLNNNLTDAGSFNIRLNASYNNLIENNTLKKAYKNLLLSYSDGNKINNNSFKESYYGASLTSSDLNTFENNTFITLFYGIEISSSYSNLINDNYIKARSTVIYLVLSDYNNITNNFIFDGGTGVYIANSNFNNGINNSLINVGDGFLFQKSDYNLIEFNTIESTYRCNWLVNSNYNSFINNTLKNGSYGIFLQSSRSATIKNNTMLKNGLYFQSYADSDWATNTIDSKNTLNGKPVIFWKYESGTVPTGAGQVIVAKSSNVIIEKQDIDNSSFGILVYSSPNTIIRNNTISYQLNFGIYLETSDFSSIVDNSVNNNSIGIYVVNSDSVDIKRNVVKDNHRKTYSIVNKGTGLELSDTNLNVIEDNDFSNNEFYGIALFDSRNGDIIDNVINFNQFTSIHAYNSRSFEISYNNISSNNNGIYVQYTTGLDINNNTINYNIVSGIDLRSGANRITDNDIKYSKSNGIYCYRSAVNLINRNDISYNTDAGISFINYADSNTVRSNYISNNDIGFSLTDVWYGYTMFNTFTKNRYGVKSDSAATYNTFYNNNFINNTNQASDPGTNIWSYRKDGNYWSDYTGLDNGANNRTRGDGKGDTLIPHNKDAYPYVQKDGWILPGIPYLIVPTELVTEGSYQIYWNQTVRTTRFNLEEDVSEAFSSPDVVYTGSSTSTGFINKPDGTYFYRIRAVNEVSKSKYSDVYKVDMDHKPTGPLNLKVLNITGNSVMLKWTLSQSGDVGEQNLFIHDPDVDAVGEFHFLTSVSNTTNEFLVTGLEEEISYIFYVTAVDHSQTESDSSNVISATTLDTTAPSAPKGFTAEGVSNTEVILKWLANTETDLEGYNIYIYEKTEEVNGTFKLHSTVSPDKKTLSITGLEEQTKYYFKINAFDEVPNHSEYSPIIMAETPDLIPPKKPTGLKIIDKNPDSISLGWNSNPDADVVGYLVYRSDSDTGLYDELFKEPIKEHGYIDYNVEEGNAYYYKIKAVDDADLASVFSDYVKVITPVTLYPPDIEKPIYDIEIQEDSIDDSKLNLKEIFSDKNNDDLDFKCEGQEHIQVRISGNGSVILEPESDWSGVETLKFTATDGIFNTTLEINVTVKPVNDPPSFAKIINPATDITIIHGIELDFAGTCIDPDTPFGGTLVFEWHSNLDGQLGFGANLSGIELSEGEHVITLTVTDDALAKTTDTVLVTVVKGKGLTGSEGISENEKISGRSMAAMAGVIVVVIILVMLLLRLRRNKGKDKESEKDILTKPPSQPAAAVQQPLLQQAPAQQVQYQYYQPVPVQQPTVPEPQEPNPFMISNNTPSNTTDNENYE